MRTRKTKPRPDCPFQDGQRVRVRAKGSAYDGIEGIIESRERCAARVKLFPGTGAEFVYTGFLYKELEPV